ncbi:MAG: hypothetical protein EBR23_13405 [Planctomycetia bacterium]|nr:hypothetical protein [Planctomycetia bacterium]
MTRCECTGPASAWPRRPRWRWRPYTLRRRRPGTTRWRRRNRLHETVTSRCWHCSQPPGPSRAPTSRHRRLTSPNARHS